MRPQSAHFYAYLSLEKSPRCCVLRIACTEERDWVEPGHGGFHELHHFHDGSDSPCMGVEGPTGRPQAIEDDIFPALTTGPLFAREALRLACPWLLYLVLLLCL